MRCTRHTVVCTIFILWSSIFSLNIAVLCLVNIDVYCVAFHVSSLVHDSCLVIHSIFGFPFSALLFLFGWSLLLQRPINSSQTIPTWPLLRRPEAIPGGYRRYITRVTPVMLCDAMWHLFTTKYFVVHYTWNTESKMLCVYSCLSVRNPDTASVTLSICSKHR